MSRQDSTTRGARETNEARAPGLRTSSDSSDSAFFLALAGEAFVFDLPTLLPITPSVSSESESSFFRPPPRRRLAQRIPAKAAGDRSGSAPGGRSAPARPDGIPQGAPGGPEASVIAHPANTITALTIAPLHAAKVRMLCGEAWGVFREGTAEGAPQFPRAPGLAVTKGAFPPPEAGTMTGDLKWKSAALHLRAGQLKRGRK